MQCFNNVKKKPRIFTLKNPQLTHFNALKKNLHMTALYAACNLDFNGKIYKQQNKVIANTLIMNDAYCEMIFIPHDLITCCKLEGYITNLLIAKENHCTQALRYKCVLHYRNPEYISHSYIII